MPCPTRLAVATAIFLLTITVFFAAGVHALIAQTAWYVVVWLVPGGIIGAQISPRLQGKISPDISERVLGALFLDVGLLMIVLQLGF